MKTVSDKKTILFDDEKQIEEAKKAAEQLEKELSNQKEKSKSK